MRGRSFFSFLNLEQPRFPIKDVLPFHAVNGAGLQTHHATVSYKNPSEDRRSVSGTPRLLLGCSQWSRALSTGLSPPVYPTLRSSYWTFDFAGLIRNPPTLILSSPKSTKASPCVVKTILCSGPGSLSHILVPPVTGCGSRTSELACLRLSFLVYKESIIVPT